jgi:hypothetical protein
MKVSKVSEQRMKVVKKLNNDTRSRKWQITINNPAEKGFTHERIKEELSKFSSMIYWCMSDEIGEEGTYHIHIFLALSSASRFSTIKSRFDGGHFEMANGTSQQNKDYVFKEGKWEKDKKAGTNLKETHEEYGEMPIERQGSRTDLQDLYDMINDGLSNYQIIEIESKFLFNIDKLERIRQTIREEQFKNEFRKLEVTYIYGSSGSGKTRGVMEKYGYQNVYRVTDYLHPFDGYKGQDVLVFEEFYSNNVKIHDMLNYLDGYPLVLPCRYMNQTACYTKVFLITNIPLAQQYLGIQEDHPETWIAFLRRIGSVQNFTLDGVTVEEDISLEKIGFISCEEDINPFEQTELNLQEYYNIEKGDLNGEF